MSAKAVNPVPDHLHTVTVRLVVRDGAAAIAFYGQAFGAVALGDRFVDPAGALIHSELQIGDSVVMLTQAEDNGGPACPPEAVGGRVTALLATYWPDVDAAWARAVGAGAEVIYDIADQFYGERGGHLRDPFGHQWMLSQRIEALSAEEMKRRGKEYFGS